MLNYKRHRFSRDRLLLYAGPPERDDSIWRFRHEIAFIAATKTFVKSTERLSDDLAARMRRFSEGCGIEHAYYMKHSTRHKPGSFAGNGLYIEEHMFIFEHADRTQAENGACRAYDELRAFMDAEFLRVRDSSFWAWPISARRDPLLVEMDQALEFEGR